MFKKYKKILKEEGFKALIQKEGWNIGLLLFLAFLVKGLIWVALIYLGVKSIT